MRTGIFRCGLLCLIAAPSLAMAGATAPLTRTALIGTWRLLAINYQTPTGPVDDPFFHGGVSGLLTYAASGWMSVQIVGSDRPKVSVEATRPTSLALDAKAAAYDSYYAYYGTWEIDPSGAQVIHHVRQALIPAENGESYSQEVTLEGNRLTFTNRRTTPSGQIVRRKVWERVEP